MAENKNKQVRLRQVSADQIHNDELKKALETLKENRNPQNEAVMFSELSKAHLLVPVQFSGNNPKNLQIKFILVNTNDGRSFFPAFTDEEEAKKLKMPDGKTNGQYIVRSLMEYEPIFHDPKTAAEGIVLNPMGANIVLPKALVSRLNSVQAAKKKETAALKNGEIPAGVQVTFSEPRIYPTALVNAVHDLCQTLPEISRVYFKQMTAGMAVSFALIVEADSFDESLSEKIHDAAVPHAKDVPVVVLKYTDDMGQKFLKGDIPLYDRELGL